MKAFLHDVLCTDHTPYTLQLGTGLRGLIPELAQGSLVNEHLEMTIPYLHAVCSWALAYGA